MLGGAKTSQAWRCGEAEEPQTTSSHRRKRVKAAKPQGAVRRSKRQSNQRQRQLRPRSKLPMDFTPVKVKPVDTCTDDEIAIVAEIVRSAKRIVAIVGAGISTSTGIPDFRSAGGLYSIVDKLEMELPQPECLFDIRYFQDDPKPFYSFLHRLYHTTPAAHSPNRLSLSKSHLFLRKLEEKRKLQRVYTQNIDSLEAKAGIKKVVYCHGSMDTCKCLSCKACSDTSSYARQIAKQQVLRCKRKLDHGTCGGLLKPNITFFGEKLPKKIDSAINADACKADLIIISGTSMKVAPVSTLPTFFPSNVPIVVVNNVPVKFQTDPEVSCTHLLGDCDSVFTRISDYLGWV